MYGLIKATHAASTHQARQDWLRIMEKWPDLAKKYEPPAGAGHRRIDKAIVQLRGELGIDRDTFWGIVEAKAGAK